MKIFPDEGSNREMGSGLKEAEEFLGARVLFGRVQP